MEEIKTYTLEELTKGRGNYGIAASAVPYNPSLRTYLRITDINDDGTLNKSSMMSVDEKNVDAFLLKPNDIVFARTGNSIGRSYFYDGSDGELVYAGFLIKFSLDETKVNPRILKYYTHSKLYYDWVHSFDTGGTRGNINAKTYGAMPIMLPSRGVQDKIVNILKSLDDKIELHRRINDNLEQQAQALFKSWFVDFEPFKGGKFVESECGMIPDGWRVDRLDSVCDVIGGGTPSKVNLEYYCKNGIAWITPKDLSNTQAKFTSHGEIDITKIGYSNSSAKMIPKGSVLFSSRAPIGYISIASNELCTNQGFKSLVPRIAGTGYLYLYLKENTVVIEAQATGSTFKEASGSLMKAQPIVIPNSTALLSEFESIVRPVFDYQESLEFENQNLAALRNSLLPQLMSGELKVNEMNR